jgi:hypothetical protein
VLVPGSSGQHAAALRCPVHPSPAKKRP